MAGRARAWPPAVVALVVLVLSGCAGSDEREGAPPRPPEKAEQVPKLPPGWTVLENESQGFALGMPPGWREGGRCLEGGAEAPSATILCSPDRLVTLSVSADRTNEALELSPREFAVRTLERLGEEAYRGLDPGKPRPFQGRYDGASVSGTATASGTGVRQGVTLVVLRRGRVVNFAALIAANADKPTEPAVKLAERSLTTLRSRPVGAP